MNKLKLSMFLLLLGAMASPLFGVIIDGHDIGDVEAKDESERIIAWDQANRCQRHAALKGARNNKSISTETLTDDVLWQAASESDINNLANFHSTPSSASPSASPAPVTPSDSPAVPPATPGDHPAAPGDPASSPSDSAASGGLPASDPSHISSDPTALDHSASIPPAPGDPAESKCCGFASKRTFSILTGIVALSAFGLWSKDLYNFAKESLGYGDPLDKLTEDELTDQNINTDEEDEDDEDTPLMSLRHASALAMTGAAIILGGILLKGGCWAKKGLAVPPASGPYTVDEMTALTDLSDKTAEQLIAIRARAEKTVETCGLAEGEVLRRTQAEGLIVASNMAIASAKKALFENAFPPKSKSELQSLNGNYALDDLYLKGR